MYGQKYTISLAPVMRRRIAKAAEQATSALACGHLFLPLRDALSPDLSPSRREAAIAHLTEICASPSLATALVDRAYAVEAERKADRLAQNRGHEQD